MAEDLEYRFAELVFNDMKLKMKVVITNPTRPRRSGKLSMREAEVFSSLKATFSRSQEHRHAYREIHRWRPEGILVWVRNQGLLSTFAQTQNL